MEEKKLILKKEYNKYRFLKKEYNEYRLFSKVGLFTTAMSLAASASYYFLMDEKIDGIIFGALTPLAGYWTGVLFKKSKNAKAKMKNLESKIKK